MLTKTVACLPTSFPLTLGCGEEDYRTVLSLCVSAVSGGGRGGGGGGGGYWWPRLSPVQSLLSSEQQQADGLSAIFSGRSLVLELFKISYFIKKHLYFNIKKYLIDKEFPFDFF